MTDRPTDRSTDGPIDGEPLTPEQEDSVARLLADAAGPVPMPADVAARLDDVLAGLVAERSGSTDRATTPPGGDRVDELARARARRRWPRVLLAAAAVVVGGYTVGTVATDGLLGGSTDSADSGAASDSSMAQEDSLGGDELQGTDQDDGAAAGDLEAAPEAFDRGAMKLLRTVRLRPDTLERDVRRALRLLDAAPAASLSRQGTELADSACPGPPLGKRDRALQVRYDGEPAVLVAGPERGGAVAATVHSCAGELLDRTRVRR